MHFEVLSQNVLMGLKFIPFLSLYTPKIPPLDCRFVLYDRVRLPMYQNQAMNAGKLAVFKGDGSHRQSMYLNLKMKGTWDRQKHVATYKKNEGEGKKGKQGKKSGGEGRDGGRGKRKRRGSHLEIVKKSVLSRSYPKVSSVFGVSTDNRHSP